MRLLDHRVIVKLKQLTVPLLIFLFILGCVIPESLSIIKNGDLWYDEAYNLQVPVSLSKFGSYATSNNGQLKIFDPIITTGAPVLFPISIVFSIFGVSYLNARWVMFFMFIAFLVITYLFVAKKAGWAAGALSLTIPLILFGPELLVHSLRVFGEIPALLFLLLGIYLYQHPKISGIFLGLSVLTKNQLIFVLVPLIVIYLIRKKLKYSTSKIYNLSFYFVGTILSWEFLQLIYLGLNSYISNKLVLWNIAIYSGIKIPDNLFSSQSPIIEKIILISNTLKTTPFILFLIVLVIIFLYIFKFKKWFLNKDKKDNDHQIFTEQSILLSTGWVYFIWWMLAANCWFRYLIPAFLLIAISLLSLIDSTYKKLSKTYWSTLLKTISIASILLLVLLPIKAMPFRLIDVPNQTLSDQIIVSNWIRENLQDTQIFYNPLWENTELSFLSDRSFFEISDKQKSIFQNNSVLIISPSEKYWSQSFLDCNKFILESNKIFSLGGYDIYNL